MRARGLAAFQRRGGRCKDMARSRPLRLSGMMCKERIRV